MKKCSDTFARLRGFLTFFSFSSEGVPSQNPSSASFAQRAGFTPEQQAFNQSISQVRVSAVAYGDLCNWVFYHTVLGVAGCGFLSLGINMLKHIESVSRWKKLGSCRNLIALVEKDGLFYLINISYNSNKAPFCDR